MTRNRWSILLTVCRRGPEAVEAVNRSRLAVARRKT